MSEIRDYVRPIGEVRKILMERAKIRRNPFEYVDPQKIEQAFDSLTSLDRDAWAEGFSALALPHEEEAQEAERAGDSAKAKESYLKASGYHRIARYPTTNSVSKRVAYERYQQNYLKASRYFDPGMEQVTMPFQGRPGEGKVIVGLLQKPLGQGPWPVLVTWGGIDTFKEDCRSGPYLKKQPFWPWICPELEMRPWLARKMPSVCGMACLTGSKHGKTWILNGLASWASAQAVTGPPSSPILTKNGFRQPSTMAAAPTMLLVLSGSRRPSTVNTPWNWRRP